MSKMPKKTFHFIFPDELRGKEFLSFASSQVHSTIVQHPLSIAGRGARMKDEVLVTGSGSILFDINLLDVLIKKSEELGGYLMPKV